MCASAGMPFLHWLTVDSTVVVLDSVYRACAPGENQPPMHWAVYVCTIMDHSDFGLENVDGIYKHNSQQ